MGFGTKVTFWEQTPELKWGGLFQMSWADSDGKLKLEAEGEELLSADFDLDIYEIQLAVGPTYKLMENVSIYGGPFLQFINGDMDAKYTEPYTGGTLKLSADVDEAAYFGGYIGLQAELIENVPFYIEYQHTAKADALGMGLLWKF